MDWTSAGFIRGEYLKDIRPVYARHWKIFTIDIHYCTNIRIDFDEDMNGATVKSKTLNVSGHPLPDGTTKMASAHGEYTDRIVKVDGEWKIASRYWDNQGSTLGAQLAEGSGGMLDN